jgi:long-chain acyl-CoA synthetase
MRLTAINWHLTADEITYIVDDSEAAALIGDSRFADVLTRRCCCQSFRRQTVNGRPTTPSSYEAAVTAEPVDDIDDLLARRCSTAGHHRPAEGARAIEKPQVLSFSKMGTAAGENERCLCTGLLYHAAADYLAHSAAGCRFRRRPRAGGHPRRRCSSSMSTESRRRTWCRRCSTVCSRFPTM